MGLDSNKKEINGDERREKLIEILKKEKTVLSGSALAKLAGVSRQVVVQDIALLRTKGYPIVATARGYMYEDTEAGAKRVFKVCHTAEQVGDELQTIVDLGGTVIDVFIKHRAYNTVSAPLNIKCRRDVAKFVEDIETSKSTLLSNATSGYHYHTVSADSEDILDEIEQALRDKKYLAELLDYEKDPE